MGWMRRSAFPENPIGSACDFRALLERDQRGDPIEALVRQGAA